MKGLTIETRRGALVPDPMLLFGHVKVALAQISINRDWVSARGIT